MKTNFTKQELIDTVNAIYCGVKPNDKDDDFLVKVADEIVNCYIKLKIPLKILINGFMTMLLKQARRRH